MNAVNRSMIGGKAPPACGMMNVMFGQRAMVPEIKRLITERAVSNKNSHIGLGYCGSGAAGVGPWLIHGVVGWIKTFALRLFSSLKIGSKVLSPR